MSIIIKILREYREAISYLFFGGLTVLINIVVFLLMPKQYLGLTDNTILLINNTIAFTIAVLFAYYTNTKYVFNSLLTLKNFISFMSYRIFTLFLDNLFMYILVTICVKELIAKIIVNFVIIVMNYFVSKFVVFKK